MTSCLLPVFFGELGISIALTEAIAAKKVEYDLKNRDEDHKSAVHVEHHYNQWYVPSPKLVADRRMTR